MADRLLTNVLSDFGGRLVHVFATGALLLLLTRTLGPDGYGVLALALSIFALSRFFSESGVPWSGARYIANNRIERPGRAVAAVYESGWLLLATAVGVSIAVAVFADELAGLLGEPALATPLFVGALLVAFRSIHQYNQVILQGFEAIVETAKLHTIEGLLSLAFVATFVVYRPSPTAAVAGYALAYASGAIVGLFLLRRVVGELGVEPVDRRPIRRKILAYNVPLSVTRLSNEIDKEVDVVLVGLFAGPVQVAFYTIGKQLSQLTRVPATSIGFALSPSYGAERGTGAVEGATEIYQESLSKTLVLYVPAAVGIFVVAGVAIPTVFGGGYAGAVPIVQLLSLFVLFEAVERITGPALDYLGRARARAILKMVTSLANLGLNLLLIPPFGAVGAAVATVITYGTYAVGSVVVVYTELPFDYRAVAGTLAGVTAIAFGMGLVVYVLLGAIDVASLALVVSIGGGIAVWSIACHLTGLLDVRRALTHIRGG